MSNDYSKRLERVASEIETLMAVVYATTSGSTPAIRMVVKICTENKDC